MHAFIDFIYFQHYRDLTLVSRDGLTIVLTKTNQIIFEKWLKLLDSTRAQVGHSRWLIHRWVTVQSEN